MPSVWRIATDTPDYGSDDLLGKGAERTGGRWNRKGIPMLYASSSIALACLETLVHVGRSLPLNRYLVRIDIPEALWQGRVVFDPAIHGGWDATPAGAVSLEWGSRWAQLLQSLVAEVPSIVIPEEANLLVNPKHPDVGQLGVEKVRKWTYDPRLG